jgi:hypothetical protein
VSFTPQSDDGDVDGANAYITVAEFTAYHGDRANTVPIASSADKQAAIVRATDYLDGRFSFRGNKLTGPEQATQWPRYEAYDNADYAINGIPQAVKDATAEYALRALSATLNPDPDLSETGRRVQSFSNSVSGAVSESVTYANGGAVELPEYPAADLKLLRAGLIRSPARSGEVRRA